MDQNNNLFVSILICCYNSERFIIDTLNSIVNQNYKNYEIVIIDDGSKDNSSFVYKTLSKKLPGIDQKASIEPKEMYYLKKNLLDTKKILGSNYKTLSNEENQTIKSLRRSLVASKRLFKGSRIANPDS